MKKIIAGLILTGFIGSVGAESVITTHTQKWTHVPITVDETTQSYNTSEGFVVPEGDFYYTYSGHRCLNNEINSIQEKPVILKPSASTGKEIYCYKE